MGQIYIFGKDLKNKNKHSLVESNILSNLKMENLSFLKKL